LFEAGDDVVAAFEGGRQRFRDAAGLEGNDAT
jgi:hypothetical protein